MGMIASRARTEGKGGCGEVYLGKLVEVGPAAAMFTAPRQKQTQNYVAGKFG